MRVQRVKMVQEGAQDLFDAEEAVVTALNVVGALPERLHQLRRQNNLSVVISRDTIQNIGRTFAAMVEAHGSIIDVHASLDDVKTKVGCRTVATGTSSDKPDGQPVIPPPSGFRVIEEDREAA